MTGKSFMKKLFSPIIWINLLAMLAVVVALVFVVDYALKSYTHHGTEISVPDFCGMNYKEAVQLAEDMGLYVIVSDSGHNKRKPAESVLVQNPEPEAKVKPGHTVSLTINSAMQPRISIPDIIDNCSVREAQAKLTALGFRLLDPQVVPGDKDWVYGVVYRGRRLEVGERVEAEAALTLVIGGGNGMSDLDEYSPTYGEFEEIEIGDDADGDAEDGLSGSDSGNIFE